MPKIDFETIARSNATGYPEPFGEPVARRWYRRVGPATGLTALGASHLTLEPGAWSSQRHWHVAEDELLVMLSGEAVLIEDEGETVLRAGDFVAWPMGVRNGHHLVNRGETDCTFICVSAGDGDAGADYPDLDMVFADGAYRHRDGTPYPPRPLP